MSTSSTACSFHLECVLNFRGCRKKALDLFADVPFMNVKWKSKETKFSAETPSMLERKRTLGSVCRLYYVLINTFVHLRLDILTSEYNSKCELVQQLRSNVLYIAAGLCYQDNILHSFWMYLSQNVCVKSFYRYASSGGAYKDGLIEDNCRILSLFSECMIHYIT